MAMVIKHESMGLRNMEHRAMMMAEHRKCNTLSLGRWSVVDSLTTHRYILITIRLQRLFIASTKAFRKFYIGIFLRLHRLFYSTIIPFSLA